jgi:hypothetical protein
LLDIAWFVLWRSASRDEYCADGYFGGTGFICPADAGFRKRGTRTRRHAAGNEDDITLRARFQCHVDIAQMAGADPPNFNRLPVHDEIDVSFGRSCLDFRSERENGTHSPFAAAAR